MSSIITNNSSIVALQTLKKLNTGMQSVQDQVSTGMKVGSAKDSASIWAIATTMRSDVSGYKAIGDALGTAVAAIGVGRDATESITDLLKQMRTKVADASAVGADTATIQTDIDNLRSTISGIVSAASFNGVNLIDGSNTSIDVLSSIDRTNGVVATDDKYITVAAYDLTESGTAGTARAAFSSANFTASADGDHLSFAADAAAAGVDTVTIDSANVAAGDTFSITIGDKTASYIVSAADVASTTPADVIAVKLKAAVDDLGVTGFSMDYDAGTPGALTINNDGTGAVDRNVSFQVAPADAGIMSGLTSLSVTDASSRTAALGTIDAALASVVSATAALGSSQTRLTTQQDFMSKLSDNVTVGIGSLVDANMEEASARLTALQTQQQLAIQSLSIANQAPQNLLALFK